MPPPNPIRLFEEDGLIFDFLPGTGPDLVVSFASIGRDALRPPSWEFLKSSWNGGQRSVLFVTDLYRSWCNAPNYAEHLKTGLALAQSRQTYEKVLYLGQSLGGFSALIAATIRAPLAVLALSPQFSVHPNLMPQDSRWTEWTGRISTFRYDHASLTPGVPTILLHGLIDDFDHAQSFPHAPGCDHYLFPDRTHSDLAQMFKTQSLLPALIECAFTQDRRRLGRLVQSAGGIRRKTDQLPR